VTDEEHRSEPAPEPLGELRARRKALREEERQVSYWRRLVQGRLDLARAALAGDEPSVERLAAAEPRGRPSRNGGAAHRSPSFARFVDGIQDRGLSGLAATWDTPIPWEDHERLREVERSLVQVEAELSRHRRELHQRIDACTAELVERYRTDPGALRRLGPSSR
jgi:RsiG-like